jgi:hypothetical protein
MTFDIELFRRVNEKYKRFIKRFDLTDYREVNILDNFDIAVYPFFIEIYYLIKSNYTPTKIHECDIYSIIIFLYYGLVLFEPHDNLLYFSDFERLSINSKGTESFCMNIAISGEEYCSKIRRFYFNMDS